MTPVKEAETKKIKKVLNHKSLSPQQMGRRGTVIHQQEKEHRQAFFIFGFSAPF